MNEYELKEILEEHKKWLNNEGGKKADLSKTNLSDANLPGFNLSSSNLSKTNLSGANLVDANLYNINLSGANLKNANLSSTNLVDANLKSANLSGSNLTNANLNYANLNYTNLSNANLSNIYFLFAIGNNKEIKTIQAGVYKIVYTEKVMAIGCEQHTIEDWFEFDDDQILEMNGIRALRFWNKWKPILKQIMEIK